MMSGLMKWKKSKNQKDGSKEKAAIIRAILGLGELTEKLDPWLPFPQNSCCFFFGKDRLPIPVGALLFLWENSFLFTGECPYCGDKTYGYSFGGLLNIGGITGCCVNCGASTQNPIGGLMKLNNLLSPALQETPYYINGLIYGGTYEGKRWPLLRALKKLGIKDLPDDEWASQSEPSAASLTVKSDEGKKKVPPIVLESK